MTPRPLDKVLRGSTLKNIQKAMRTEANRIGDAADEGRFQQGHHLSALALWYLAQSQEKRDEIIRIGTELLDAQRAADSLAPIVPPGKSVPSDVLVTRPERGSARIGEEDPPEIPKRGKAKGVYKAVDCRD